MFVGLRGRARSNSQVAAAAKHAGTTAHAFMLEAIAEKVEQAERRAYLEARMDRKTAKRPVGRKLAG